MKLLVLIYLLTFGAITINADEILSAKKSVKTKVVKTVSSKTVGARTFNATAYCLKGRMANGQTVHSGAIAADPRVLPLGTKVYIEGMGSYVVKDTGGAIKGNKIDVWLASCSQARKFGRRPLQLTIIK